MAPNRPVGHRKNVAEGGSGAARRGAARTGGPVGSSGGYRKSSGGGAPLPSGGGGGSRAGKIGGGISLPVILIAILYMVFGGGLGGNTGSPQENYQQPVVVEETTSAPAEESETSGVVLNDFYQYFQQQTGHGSSQQSPAAESAVSSINTEESPVSSVSAEAPAIPAKRTQILGGGQDQITIMVYMCGTDLESRSSMATSDLVEMTKASFGDNIQLLVYTGGCSRWQNNIISSSVNQIYRLAGGRMERLVADDGAKPMTDPSTLSSFIRWSAENYPANRYELILWDHGGGSVSGYGYDEKNKRSGSMNLAGLNTALKDGGVTFDFIGFDACLMATAETALMADNYADYLIASEETEPGIGWYYTNWLTKLGQNTSMPTTEIGRNIIDDFTTACAKSCRGQKTTLSIIDLAEFSAAIPPKMTAFSSSVRTLLKEKQYRTVSDARYTAREFASSTKIDQVDLVDLAKKMGTAEGDALAEALRSAIKYNRTSSNMTNAYGVSIYFPYQKAKYVDTMCSTYSAIGMDEEYAKCIREFASLETSGQIAAGGSVTSSPYGSLFGSLFSESSSGSAGDGTELGGFLGSLLNNSTTYTAPSGYTNDGSELSSMLGTLLGGGSSAGNADMIGSLLGSFLSNPGMINGLTGSNIGFFSDRALSEEDTIDYIAENSFDPAQLTWTEHADGTATLSLPEEQWALVHDLDLNMFYDDGSGYIDLGLDNVFDFTESGDLIADTDRTWLAVNGQVVSYNHEKTIGNESNYTITGYIPALLNGEQVQLQVVFDTENPDGYIAGATVVYNEETSLTLSKELTEIRPGDTIDFLCDYYSYNGDFLANYFIGESLTVGEEPLTLSYVNVGEGDVHLMYRFTDLYNQEYWTETLIR